MIIIQKHTINMSNKMLQITEGYLCINYYMNLWQRVI